MSYADDEYNITNLLMTRAALMESDGPALPVMFQNEDFSAPTDGKYLEVIQQPNTDAWGFIGDDGPYIAQGLLTIIVHYPVDEGTLSAMQICGEVKDFFPKGWKSAIDGLTVKVSQKPYSGSASIGDDDLQITVTVPYSADVDG